MILKFKPTNLSAQKLLSLLYEIKSEIYSFHTLEPSLNDIFKKITRKKSSTSSVSLDQEIYLKQYENGDVEHLGNHAPQH